MSCEDISACLEQVAQQVEAFTQELEQVLPAWEQSLFQPLIEQNYRLNEIIMTALSPHASYFASFDSQGPVFAFRDVSGNIPEDKQVIPTSAQADLITALETPLGVRNLYDLVCLSTKLILSYLGAQSMPRGWYPAGLEEIEGPPAWQVSSLADHIAQIHQELRDLSIVKAEVRVGPNEEDKDEVTASLPEAVGSLLGAVSEVALDAQRAHILSAQAAKGTLTVSAQLGTRTFPGTVDLGWRGKVFAPATDAGSIAEALAAIESQLNSISLALGIAPRPER